MYSAFEKLPQDKREAIISICIEEFAQRGYTNTSTDVITKRAGISKGILFHYFKSKKNLYLYIVNYVIDFLTDITLKEFNKIESREFFEKMKQLTLVKQRITMAYPNETKLIMGILTTPPPSISKEVEEIREKSMKNSYSMQYSIMKDMIPPKLREGVSMERALEVTQAIFSHIINKYIAAIGRGADLKDIQDNLDKEFDEYIDIIRNGIY